MVLWKTFTVLRIGCPDHGQPLLCIMYNLTKDFMFFALFLIEIKLIYRNKRMRFLPINLITQIIIGLFCIAYSIKKLFIFITIVGCLYVIGAFSLVYSLHSFRFRSSFYDGLITRPLKTKDILKTLILFVHLGSLVTFGILLTFLYFLIPDKDVIAFILYILPFAMGVMNYSYFFGGTYDIVRFEPNKDAFSFDGAFSTQPFKNIALTSMIHLLIPLVPYMLTGRLINFWLYLFIAAPGFIGLSFHRIWINRIENSLENRKYLISESFRKR
jgi:hypothetical protein